VGPVENSTRPAKDQKHGPAARGVHRPRTRRCLLKGCEQRFRPQRARQRYCSDTCRRAAREWSRWKAQQGYRATAAGRDRRNGQSRRYRQRVRNRKQPTPKEPLPLAARVITNNFFRPLLRPAGLLPGICSPAAIAPAALLFARVPAGPGTRPAAGMALAPGSAGAVEDARPPLPQISRTY
jgi:hypothetical protein